MQTESVYFLTVVQKFKDKESLEKLAEDWKRTLGVESVGGTTTVGVHIDEFRREIKDEVKQDA